MDYSEKYIKIVNVIYHYYGMSEGNLIELLKDNDAKYLLLLLLQKHKCINQEKIKDLLNIKTKQSLTNNLKRAEKKLLINRDFREKYFELEEGLLKKG